MRLGVGQILQSLRQRMAAVVSAVVSAVVHALRRCLAHQILYLVEGVGLTFFFLVQRLENLAAATKCNNVNLCRRC